MLKEPTAQASSAALALTPHRRVPVPSCGTAVLDQAEPFQCKAIAVAGPVLGGLVLYRHGRRLSTAHSADVADRRRDHPGTMHLLRWRAIQLALAERRPEMDLGGVDVAGARRPPEPGEPTFGLYEHKRSFGATLVEMAGAQERVARAWRYAAGRAASRAMRMVRR